MVRAVVGTLLAVGRGRLPESALADALAARDRRAAGVAAPSHGLILHYVGYADPAFAGCDASIHHTEAHHCLPWEHHGPTDLCNLCLVCKRHHRLIHHHNWTMHVTEGQVSCTDQHGRTVPTNQPHQPSLWTPR